MKCTWFYHIVVLVSTLLYFAEAIDVLVERTDGSHPYSHWKNLVTPAYIGHPKVETFNITGEMLLATNENLKCGSAHGRVIFIANHVGDHNIEVRHPHEWIKTCHQVKCIGIVKQSVASYSGAEALWSLSGYDDSRVDVPMVDISKLDGEWLYQEVLRREKQIIPVRLVSGDHNSALSFIHGCRWYRGMRWVELTLSIINLVYVLYTLMLCYQHYSESFVSITGIWALVCLLISSGFRCIISITYLRPNGRWGILTWNLAHGLNWTSFVLTILASLSLGFSVFNAFSRLNGRYNRSFSRRSHLTLVIVSILVVVIDFFCCIFPLLRYGAHSPYRMIGFRLDASVGFIIGIVFVYYALKLRSVLLVLASSSLGDASDERRAYVVTFYRRILTCAVGLLFFSAYAGIGHMTLWRDMFKRIAKDTQTGNVIDFHIFIVTMLLLQFCLIRASVIRLVKKSYSSPSASPPQQQRVIHVSRKPSGVITASSGTKGAIHSFSSRISSLISSSAAKLHIINSSKQ